MFAPFRLTRLLTLGLAACMVTWLMAASAMALPVHPPPQEQSTTTGDRPAFKPVPGDVKTPENASRPDFKAVPGDVKEPEAGTRPAFEPAAGDVKSNADRARAVDPFEGTAPANVAVPVADDDTSTVALVLSIAAILTALGAVTLTVTRTPRGVLRA
jgi:hypothetical protein